MYHRPGNDVAVGQRPRMRMGLGGHHVDVAGRGQLDDHLTRPNCAGRVILDGRIGAAGDDRRARQEAGLRGGRWRDLAHDVGRRDQRRQDAQRQPRQPAQLIRPATAGHIVEQAPLGLDMIGLPGPRQLPPYVVLCEEHVDHAVQQRRARVRRARPVASRSRSASVSDSRCGRSLRRPRASKRAAWHPLR